jgi:hypothetical protein
VAAFNNIAIEATCPACGLQARIDCQTHVASSFKGDSRGRFCMRTYRLGEPMAWWPREHPEFASWRVPSENEGAEYCEEACDAQCTACNATLCVLIRFKENVPLEVVDIGREAAWPSTHGGGPHPRSHVAHGTQPCPTCGAEARVSFVARARESRLRYSESVHCEHCGLAQEADGDALSDAARAAFYAAEGKWSAHVRDLCPRRTAALRVLRTLRAESPSELLELVRSGTPLVTGTLVEVECVAEPLREVGAKVDLVLQDRGGAF